MVCLQGAQLKRIYRCDELKRFYTRKISIVDAELSGPVLSALEQCSILDSFGLFYDPLAQVTRLLSLPGWLQEKENGDVSPTSRRRPNGASSRKPEIGPECFEFASDSKAQEIAVFLISTLYKLEVWETKAVQCEIPGRWMVPCFYDRRTTKSLSQIFQAIYPKLRLKGQQEKADRTRNSTKHVFHDPKSTAKLEVQVSRKEFRDSSDDGYKSLSCRYTFTFRGNPFWIRQQQQDRQIYGEFRTQYLLLTLAMGLHDRLGAGSHLKSLPVDVLREIGKLALNEVFLSCFQATRI